MSQQLQASIFRIACNQSARDGATDKLSGRAVQIWKGSTAKFQHALFLADPSNAANFIDDISNVISATLVVRKTNAAGDLLLTKTVAAADMTGGLSFADWSNNVAQHFEFDLSSTDTNQTITSGTALQIYFAIAIETADSGTIPVCEGAGTIQDPGVGTAGTPTAPDYTAYSKAESDARYARGNLTDTVTGTVYQLTVANGVLALTEV